ncbi:MAG: hypothetical protein ACI94Y_001870 [Maribacter sp.]|jgi:hypothetical protein
MKKQILIFSLLLVSSFLMAQTTKGKLYSVTNMKQFLDVLGPDRTIELAAEFFFLPKELENGLVLDKMDGLKIIGYDEKTVRFVTPMPDVPVITFKNSRNVSIENIEMGHAPEKATVCDGHVVSFIDCKDIMINNCFLFGSGYQGINAERVKGMECNNTIIRGCTGRILTVSDSEDVTFTNCTFTDNVGTNSMISFTKSKKITMDNCEISLNRMEYNETQDMMSGYAVFATYDCKKVTATNCRIVGNSTPFLFETKTGITIEECDIHSNFVSVQDYRTKD